jgi:hypothetical protein
VIQFAKYSFLALLTAHLVWRGLVPAFTAVDTDFPNYYVASQLALEGQFDRVYDDVWFQEQIRSAGMASMGKFSPYPPITAFVMMPLAWLGPLNALRAWTVINIGVLICSIMLLSQMLKKDWLWSALMLLLSGHALVNNFRFGQFYLILSLLTLWSFSLWQRDRKVASGVLMGIGAALKYFPILFLPLLMFRKEWKIAAGMVGTIIALSIVSIVVLGLEPHRRFIEATLVPHLQGNIQNRFSMNFQSWNSLFARLMIFDSTLNPQPVLNSPIWYAFGLVASYTSVVTLLVLGMKRAAQIWKDRALNVQFALLCIGGIVLFPASATYHFLLLSVPVSILLALGKKTWSIEQKIILGLYVCIGFIPYSLLREFDGKGLLTLLAYPRLLMTTMIFAATLLFVERSKALQTGHHEQVQIA